MYIAYLCLLYVCVCKVVYVWILNLNLILNSPLEFNVFSGHDGNIISKHSWHVVI